ncbi:macro domain-containing protein [Eubacterium oxidoreducens]|uniref:O-acetyl-ADP-ribose deacetylase (Regulator of RNase III), contains Macro domain n=1 Tax=Eubacterium oxidoreducens TaxID=1732 RepID=A0A1G6BDB9_EUBOX|nr:macro domain-containing protein [Eubacterium oxidoreducens]SDB18632.1 O-acetyl-ADP-ribose deacetylase (regulator of RNase III), contains Macro domain [Eubacterium oxidoreducens]
MPFQIVRNDITKMHVDAIVNTANPLPGYGPGTDAAVYKAAGEEQLLTVRYGIGVIERGHSVITDGFKLPAKYIIHTVGTAWLGGNSGEEDIIRNCYRSVFRVAQENAIESLAIPLLASGSYGFPKEIALRIALSEIEAFMSNHDLELYLVVFDEKAFLLSSELYGEIDEYINNNYVEEKKSKEYLFSSQIQYEEALLTALSVAGRAFSNTDRKDSEKERKRKGTAKDAKVYGDFEEVEACEMNDAALSAEKSLDDVVKRLDKTFMELVFSFADEREMTDVEVQKKANLDRKAFSKLKCGTTKNPSKSTALALAVALELSLDDTKDLLSRAGLALSPCSKRDVIVQYFIEKQAYDIYEINVALFEHGEQLLGNQVS